jgi:hypothetical protein
MKYDSETEMPGFDAVVELWRACTKFPEAMKYLAAFTIYNDSVFAFSVSANLSLVCKLEGTRPKLNVVNPLSVFLNRQSLVSSTTFNSVRRF